MSRQPALMDPRTARRTYTPEPAPRTFPWSAVWFVTLALTLAAGVTWYTLNPQGAFPALMNVGGAPSNPDVVPASNGSSTGKIEDRAFAIATVDVDQGMTPLYPVRPGRVVEVYVKEGQEVEKDAALLKIDDALAKLELAQAKTALKAAREGKEKAEQFVEQHQKAIKVQEEKVKVAKGDVAVAKANVEKARALFKNRVGGVIAEDVTTAEELVKKANAAVGAEQAGLDQLRAANPNIAIKLAESDIESKQQQIEKAELGLRECVMRSPEKGMILRRYVNVGETLGTNPMRPAIEFAAGERIVRAELEQEFSSIVRVGMKVTVQDYEMRGGGTWEGEVVRIAPFIAKRRDQRVEPLQFNDTRTRDVIIRLKADVNGKLVHGQRVRVMMEP